MKVKSLSRVQLFTTPWTVAYQASLSMGFSRQEYWSGCHFLLQEIFPTQGLNLGLPHCRQTLYHLSHQGSPDLERIRLRRNYQFSPFITFQVLAVTCGWGFHAGQLRLRTFLSLQKLLLNSAILEDLVMSNCQNYQNPSSLIPSFTKKGGPEKYSCLVQCGKVTYQWPSDPK